MLKLLRCTYFCRFKQGSPVAPRKTNVGTAKFNNKIILSKSQKASLQSSLKTQQGKKLVNFYLTHDSEEDLVSTAAPLSIDGKYKHVSK